MGQQGEQRPAKGRGAKSEPSDLREAQVEAPGAPALGRLTTVLVFDVESKPSPLEEALARLEG